MAVNLEEIYRHRSAAIEADRQRVTTVYVALAIILAIGSMTFVGTSWRLEVPLPFTYSLGACVGTVSLSFIIVALVKQSTAHHKQERLYKEFLSQ